MPSILVTGATGNVGPHVVGALRRRGAQVRALAHERQAAFGPDVEVVTGDLGDRDSVLAACKGIDVLFLACANHPMQVEWETGAIDAAAEAGVRRIVKLSARGAGTGPEDGFWAWHGRIEDHLLASGIPSVLLRPHFSMANLLGSAGSISAAGMLFAPIGRTRVPMIDPRDIAETAAVTLTSDGHDGRAYVLTGPEPLTFEEVAAVLSEVAGRRIGFADVPEAAALDALLMSGVPEPLARNVITVFGMLRAEPEAELTDTVEVLTGTPPRRLDDYARDHAAQLAL
jgi:uncharacterized protein YbjT (DUF2867 family)